MPIRREEIIGDCRLILGDNMPLMAGMAANEFQLAIVDPQYGISVNMNAGRKRDAAAPKRENKKWDDKIPGQDYFDEMFRVSMNSIVWGGNYFNLKTSQGWIFWDKCVAEEASFSDGELAWTSFSRALKKIVIPWSGFIGADGQRIHPTQKPVALYRWLLKNYAKEGDHIIDTHGGSMSSVIACLEMGYKCTAIEIDEDYFNAGVERVRQHQRQGKLFTPPKQQPKPQGLF